MMITECMDTPIKNEYEERKQKRARLEEQGINPYPAVAKRTHTIRALHDAFEQLAESAQEVTVSGRLRSKRTHGNLSFADIEDASGRIQIALSKKELSDPASYKTFVKLIDVSDFVEVTGTLFTTKAGQKTLKATQWKLLTKALRNLPTEHYGLQDDDARLRQRYIDLALQRETRELFVRRAMFWRVMRSYMEKAGFIHVETPTLEVTTGGAEARPFRTHHNDFDLDVHLRISIGELWQKRLMVGGFEKTYEIGRAYRNEGSSPNHLQEFTNMEFYWAYAHYRDGMNFVMDLYRTLATEVYGTTRFSANGHTFDLADEWKEIDYREEVLAQTGIDVLHTTPDAIKKKLDDLGVKHDAKNKERLIDNLWKYCRKNIAGPAFLVGHPVFIAPLSKRKEDQPQQVEKFQPILAGAEVGNGYSELNDPIDQRERFEAQNKLLRDGDDEAMMPDWDFVEALEYGMPPTCGFGMGERLFAFFEGKPLREVTLFPLMRPKE